MPYFGYLEIATRSATALLFLLCLQTEQANANDHILVDPPIRISAPGAGGYFWLTGNTAAEPSGSNRIVTCGIRVLQSPASWQVYLYQSNNGGRSWLPAYVDSRPSDGHLPELVSEANCGFGRNNTIALGSSAWGRYYGRPFHLVISSDGGTTWHQGGERREWVDAARMAIDASGRKHQNAIYIFRDVLDFSDQKKRGLTQTPLLFSKDGGSSVIAAKPAFDLRRYTHGAFPSAVAISEGDVPLAAYYVRYGMQNRSTPTFGIELVSSRDGGRTVASPTILSSWADALPLGTSAHANNFRMVAGIAVDHSNDRFHGRIYVAWARPIGRRPGTKIEVIHSDDEGKTWSKPIRADDASDHPSEGTILERRSSDLASPTLAVGNKGMVGLVWEENDGSCRRFSASSDGGETFLGSVAVSPCGKFNSILVPNKNYLTAFDGPIDVTSGARAFRFDQIGFNINELNWESEAALAATADGRFHVVYNNVADGSLWTASISVGNALAPELSIRGLKQEDQRFRLLVDNVYYDETDAYLVVDVRILNASDGLQPRFPGQTFGSEWQRPNGSVKQLDAPVFGPMLLQLRDYHSDSGPLTLMNPDGHDATGAPLIDFSSSIPPGGLKPGQTTSPIRLVYALRYPGRTSTGSWINVRGHVFIR